MSTIPSIALKMTIVNLEGKPIEIQWALTRRVLIEKANPILRVIVYDYDAFGSHYAPIIMEVIKLKFTNDDLGKRIVCHRNEVDYPVWNDKWGTHAVYGQTTDEDRLFFYIDD